MKIKLTKSNLDKLSAKGIEIDPDFTPNKRYWISDKLKLETPIKFCADFYKDITIGSNSYSKSPVNYCDIGRYSSIAIGVSIGQASDHPVDWFSTSGFQYEKSFFGKKGFSQKFQEVPRTIIGNDVWIGLRAIIKCGVKIGDGAIIGCGAVVTKDVPPYAIVGGVPAKVLRYRFEPEIIKELLELKWWDYDYSHFYSIDFSNPVEAINILKSRLKIVPKLGNKIFQYKDFLQFQSRWNCFKEIRRRIKFILTFN